MGKLIVNGKEYTDTRTVKLYNLLNHLVYCIDVFVSSSDNAVYNWLLTPLPNGKPKMSLVFDGDPNRTYPLKFGSFGESFSNPISYIRDGNHANGIIVSNPSSPTTSSVRLDHGWTFTMLVTQDGELYTWGRNNRGECGVGEFVDNGTSVVVDPQQVITPTLVDVNGEKVIRACSTITTFTTMILTELGNLYICGQKSFYDPRLPEGTILSFNQHYITPVLLFEDTGFVDIEGSHGGGHGVGYGLKADGTLWGWGDNSDYHHPFNANLADGFIGDDTDWLDPVHISTGHTYKKIKAHLGGCLALDMNDELWWWGSRWFWNLPLLGRQSVATDVLDMDMSDNHFLIVFKDGSLKGTGGDWGWGILGQGVDWNNVPDSWEGTNQEYWAQYNPQEEWYDGELVDVPMPNSVKVAKVSCGPFETLVLGEDGNIYVCGYNTYYDLGIDSGDDSIIRLAQITTSGDFVDVMRQYEYSNYAVKADGSIYAWGKNWNTSYSQLNMTLPYPPELYLEPTNLPAFPESESGTTEEPAVINPGDKVASGDRTSLWLPSNQPEYAEEKFFISGSNKSSAGANWNKFPDEVYATDTEKAWTHGINIGYGNNTKDDYVLLEFKPDFSVTQIELDTYLPKITFVVTPSLHNQLQYSYMNFIDQKERPKDTSIGVRYK
jgi:alpha-tubulin suppressor-like RCC1 family protein